LLSTPVRLQMLLDRVLAIALGTLLVGTALAFGGAAWWVPAAIAVLIGLIVVAWLSRVALSGKLRMLKSPLAGLGALAIGFAVFQSVPIPAEVAGRISPRTRAVMSIGVLPDVARSDDPDVVLPPNSTEKTPSTIDRAATLRWIATASACLALFWISSHYTDRLGRLHLIWGCVVAAFLINAAIVTVQLVGQAEGLYGFIEPGKGPKWGPNRADALAAPGETVLRNVATKSMTHVWTVANPGHPRAIGTMMGGADAFLALASLGLPLAVAMTLQLMAPRGSREGLWLRLAQSGQGSLLVLLYLSTILGACMVGLLAGRTLAIPFGLALIVIGIPSLFGTGLRFKGFLFTSLCLGALAGGVVLGDRWGELLPKADPLPRVDFARARGVWSDALPILKDFPLVGTGLGSFPSILPYYKTRDTSSTTAMSSLLQWWVESGVVGLGLLGLAALWGLIRLPGAIGRVGSADRALALGLIGAVICFGIVSGLHWTVELVAVALAASAVGGTCNRWLAGGTDLFVERG
jgi:hypothetical protein